MHIHMHVYIHISKHIYIYNMNIIELIYPDMDCFYTHVSPNQHQAGDSPNLRQLHGVCPAQMVRELRVWKVWI